MAAGLFSKEEKKFIIEGIQSDFRTDGRSCSDYRHFTVNSGTISSANGSAQVKLVSSDEPKKWA